MHIYTDGTLLINHGGTEMGQGLLHEGCPSRRQRIRTASERRAYLGDGHVEGAEHTRRPPHPRCRPQRQGRAGGTRILRERLVLLRSFRHKVAASKVRFVDGHVRIGKLRIDVPRELVAEAYVAARFACRAPATTRRRRSIGTAAASMAGRFFYFAYGAAVSEVAVVTLSGETQLLRVRHPPRRRCVSSIRQSMWVRSKAAFCRASAG